MSSAWEGEARPDYGIDAPVIVRRLAVVGVATVVVALILRAMSFGLAAMLVGAVGMWSIACALVMLAGSRVGKFRLRDALLSRIAWRGDERVLDVGCGHGLLLVAAAKRLSTGRAVGIDIWSQIDQADNRPERTVQNARLEGVADRVDVRDGDARKLAFPDEAFDVVVSSFALHNIPAHREREQAVREIIRVMKPGGRVAIVDVWRISQYRRVFRESGLEQVRLSRPSFWFLAPSFILTAVKPATIACLAALAFFCTAPCAAQVDLAFPREPEREVKLPGRGAFTGARLYAPEGAGPFPAVVLSHTCGPLRQHVFEWAQRFLGAGYAVLVVDHLGPRRIGTNCSTFTVSVTEYAQDAVAGMRHLRSMPFVDGRRIALMGLSYGAMASLRTASEKFRAKHLDGERFAAIISLYPWCNQQGGREYRDHQWNFYDDTTIPLLVLLGGDDDEADPRSCIEMAKKNAAKGMPVEFTVFPGTTHAFDHSLMGDKPVVTRQGNHTVTYRYNRESVEASWQLALEFLRRRVGDSRTR